MRTVAIAIKHPIRDWDFRVDIVEVEDNITNEQIIEAVQREMLGPFEVLWVTERVNLKRKWTSPNACAK